MAKMKGGRKRPNKPKGRGHNRKNARYYAKRLSGMVNDASGRWVDISSARARLSGKIAQQYEKEAERCAFNKTKNKISRENRGQCRGSSKFHA